MNVSTGRLNYYWYFFKVIWRKGYNLTEYKFTITSLKIFNHDRVGGSLKLLTEHALQSINHCLSSLLADTSKLLQCVCICFKRYKLFFLYFYSFLFPVFFYYFFFWCFFLYLFGTMKNVPFKSFHCHFLPNRLLWWGSDKDNFPV